MRVLVVCPNDRLVPILREKYPHITFCDELRRLNEHWDLVLTHPLTCQQDPDGTLWHQSLSVIADVLPRQEKSGRKSLQPFMVLARWVLFLILLPAFFFATQLAITLPQKFLPGWAVFLIVATVLPLISVIPTTLLFLLVPFRHRWMALAIFFIAGASAWIWYALNFGSGTALPTWICQIMALIFSGCIATKIVSSLEKETAAVSEEKSAIRPSSIHSKVPESSCAETAVSPPRILSAHDLISQFLELREMSPNLKEWSEEAFADNPPRLIRLKRLMALFRAYSIPWEPFRFSIGAFISQENPLYVPLLEKGRSAKGLPPASHLQNCFETLLEYRRTIESMRCFSHGILGAFGLWAYAHRAAWGVTEKTLENVRGLDDDLAFIVDPERKTFSVEEMVSRYGYLDTNLTEVDLEWF